MMMMMSTDTKVALVTGGSRGIGKACVLALAAAGYTVAFTYHSNAQAAQAVCDEVTAAGGQAQAFASNAADAEACKTLVEQVVAQWGRLDALVNNAGITKDTLAIRMSDEDWDAVIQTNLSGPFYLCRAAAKVMMKQRSGAIVNMSSVVGVFGNAGQTNYAASKAGLIGLTKSFAKELGPRGITVNAVAPGFIETDMTHVLPEAAKEALLGHICLKRLGQVEDIAKAVLFLVTSGQYISGQVLGVDGGMAF
jgi:3-oxoacyl-[acyl-carrier protein] reductase